MVNAHGASLWTLFILQISLLATVNHVTPFALGEFQRIADKADQQVLTRNHGYFLSANAERTP